MPPILRPMGSPQERIAQLLAAVAGEPELIALVDVVSKSDEIDLKGFADRLAVNESEVRARARRLRHLTLASVGCGEAPLGRETVEAPGARESERLLDRLADLFDQVPPENLAEADAELQAMGLDPEAVGRRLAHFAEAILDVEGDGDQTDATAATQVEAEARTPDAPEPWWNDRKTVLYALSARRVVALAARSEEHSARSEDRSSRWGALATLPALIRCSENVPAGKEAVATEEIEVIQWPVVGRRGTLVIGLRFPQRLSDYADRFRVFLVAADSPVPIGPVVDARPGQELQASFEISEERQRQWAENLEAPESWPFRLVLSAGKPP